MPEDRDERGELLPTMGSSDVDEPGKTGKVATTPGTGGGVAESGQPGPGPSTRAAGGGKSPEVSHDIPPSAREQ